jgi:hypothetical protein
MIDLADNLAHKHLLSDETHNDDPTAKQSLKETTDIT